MKMFRLFFVGLIFIMASCESANYLKPSVTSQSSTSIKSRKRPMVSDFDLASIRSRINAVEHSNEIDTVELIKEIDTVELMDYYRILDTLQQRHIYELELRRQEIIHQMEWVNWLKEDTSVFFRQWSNHDIPPCLAKQIEVYTLVGSVKQCLDGIDQSIASVRKENPKLSPEYMKPVILARINDLMDRAGGLLAQLEGIALKETLSNEQYEYCRTQAVRYNAYVDKYYD